MKPSEAYAQLRDHYRDTELLGSVDELLHWDQRTMQPPAGDSHRCAQIALLSSLLHARRTDPRIGHLLEEVQGSSLVDDPLSPEAVNIREWRRRYDRDVRIPASLRTEIDQLAAESETAWERTRPASDWKTFKPYLARMLALKLEEAKCLGLGSEPYDSLLDAFEPGETAAGIEPVFKALTARVVTLAQAIAGSPGHDRRPAIPADFPVPAQEAFAREVIGVLGYDMTAGRMDISAHPFSTTIGPGDSRITVRYDVKDLGLALLSAVHEAGHSMYSQGLPAGHYGTPMGDAVSMAVHESQSRLWENIVARSKGFWRHFYPLAQRHFPCLHGVSLDDFHFALNATRPSLIRTEADEVTYDLHILLRFELELALTRGQLTVDDLPEAWNERMRRYMGITPPTPALGVMQDVHWAAGEFGYFPTYTLGNVYAAQLFDKAALDLGDPEEQFAAGEFGPLLSWLRDKIHSQGCRYAPRDLIRQATGHDPDASHLAAYLERRYRALYDL